MVGGNGTSILVAAVGFGDRARFLLHLAHDYLVGLMHVNCATSQRTAKRGGDVPVLRATHFCPPIKGQ